MATAYKKARTLYRQGKYNEAIKAFDEVKDLRYHPILDYGIANCYAALRDYNKGIYYLEKYIKNFAKFQMSPKHPTVADVKEKIKSWRKLASNPGAGGTTPPAPGAGTSGGTGGGAAADPNMGGADPVPGPDPYAVPPPPGGGSTGGVYGAGGGGAPPPPMVHRRRGPARRSLILSIDFGAAAFAAQSASFENTRTGGGVTATVLWRFLPFLAVGVHGGVSAVGSEYEDWEYDPLVFAVGTIMARGILPLGLVDLWAGVGIGYASISQSYWNPVYGDTTVSVSGPAVQVGVGLDWFFRRTMSLGIVGRIYKMFPTKACINDLCEGIDDADPGVAWFVGLAATYHIPLLFGRPRQ